MKKIFVALIIGSLLTATTAAPVFADDWNGHSHLRGGIFNPLWPIEVALSIPVAVIGTIAHATIPEPVGYYAPPPVPVAPPVYSAPPTYYAPEPYYAPRVYAAPRGYYAPRGHYRHYRSYRNGW
jgi:hypothetical protein